MLPISKPIMSTILSRRLAAPLSTLGTQSGAVFSVKQSASLFPQWGSLSGALLPQCRLYTAGPPGEDPSKGGRGGGGGYCRWKGGCRRGRYILVGVVAIAAIAAFWRRNGECKFSKDKKQRSQKEKATFSGYVWRELDYMACYGAIKAIMADEKHDYGTWGPSFLRLAGNMGETYDRDAKVGGSQGAGIRLTPEIQASANKGLDIVMDRLEVVKREFPRITYADLYSLAGVVAVQELGGPTIPWRPGRIDMKPRIYGHATAPLPDSQKNAEHVRDVFNRMGFIDKEIVALMGAHSIGRCHKDISECEGSWTSQPKKFDNGYFKVLVAHKWAERENKGIKYYVDAETQKHTMLPTDIDLALDPQFSHWVAVYAADSQLYFDNFSMAFGKLMSLGVDFPSDAPNFRFEVNPISQ